MSFVLEPGDRVVVTINGEELRGYARAFSTERSEHGVRPTVQVDFDLGLVVWVQRSKVRPVGPGFVEAARDAVARLRSLVMV